MVKLLIFSKNHRYLILRHARITKTLISIYKDLDLINNYKVILTTKNICEYKFGVCCEWEM